MQDKIFYNYVYLDPRKPGNYNYGGLHFDFEVFYVGKGKYDRCYSHLLETIDSTYNPKKFNKIQKIKREGFDPIVLKIYENLEEDVAFQNEIYLISIIGRHDKKLGPLTNLNDGGYGSSGLIVSDKVKKGRSDRMKGNKNIMFNKKHNNKTKSKIKAKSLINNKGLKNPNTVKYFIQTGDDKILEIISYKKVLETLGCSKRFLVSKKYKDYKLIKKIKINSDTI